MVARWALDMSQPLLLCPLKPESFYLQLLEVEIFFSDSEKELDPI